jgi:hypothetical protein
MKYFRFSQSEEESKDFWDNSQFELSDIVLSLTDNQIIEGLKNFCGFKHPINYPCGYIDT